MSIEAEEVEQKQELWVSVLKFVIFFIIPWFLVVFVEYLHRGSIFATGVWIVGCTKAFLLNGFIVVLMFWLVQAIINRAGISFMLIAAHLLLFGLISAKKHQFLGEFLYPWDVYFYKQVKELVPLLYKEINLFYVLGVILTCFIISFLWTMLVKKLNQELFRFSFFKRFGIFVACHLILLSFAFYLSTPMGIILEKIGIQHDVSQQRTNYEANGFILSYLLNTRSAIILEPENYNKENVRKISQDLKLRYSQSTDVESGGNKKKPNIIVVMSESFWDPTKLKGVQFNRDPLPTVRKYQNGQLLSSQFGGGTANVEFEFLTGLSTRFLPQGSVPYQQYIKKEIPSLARVVRDNGYYSLAIHPYYKWFWNRNNVYEYLGFNEFISLKGFRRAERKGHFVSDEELADSIIENTAEIKKPVFIFAVTMENHIPYDFCKYPNKEVKIESKLSPRDNLVLGNYTQGVFDADKSLNKLISYYQKSQEPTIIVFFGDHLPYLGANYILYRKLNYIIDNKETGGQWTMDDRRRMRSTPLVVWNNFGVKEHFEEEISPAFLSARVLNLAGLELPMFYEFLSDFQNRAPGFSPRIVIKGNGGIYYDSPESFKEMVDRYAILQYDILFGRGYGIRDLYH